MRFGRENSSSNRFCLVLRPGIAGRNVVGQIFRLRVLGRKLGERQYRGHNTNDDGCPGVSAAAMFVGCMLQVFLRLLKFIAHAFLLLLVAHNRLNVFWRVG